jgi:WYL_2, Sm-like SH3 beta-barrel fold
MTTLEITNAINTFNPFYGQIDDNTEYSFFAAIDKSIDEAIKTVTPEQAREIYSNLLENRKPFSHAKKLFAMIPANEPTPEAVAPVAIKSAKKFSLFNNAWSMFKDGLFTTFAQALKAAWNRLKVVTGMKTGVVTFQYIKSDGSIRIATGTLSDIKYVAKTTESKPKPEVVKYFDIEAQSFRSFRVDRFIGLVA